MKYLIFFISCSLLFNQKQTIVGKVYDKKTNLPLEFANVYIENTAFGSATDMDGNYEIKSLSSGRHKLIATFSGYINAEVYLETSDDYPHVSHMFYLEENIFEADLMLVEADKIIEVTPITMLQLKRKFSIYPPRKQRITQINYDKSIRFTDIYLNELNQVNWFEKNLNYILIGVGAVGVTFLITQ